MKFSKAISFALISSAFSLPALAQVNAGQLSGRQTVVTTSVPFLSITPDTRAGGMGDQGVATSPDAASMHWNPAKLAFATDPMAFSISYVPWLRSLIPDISMSYVSGYKRIDKLSTVGGSFRYFSLGDIQFTDNSGNNLKTHRPYELALDLGYARQLGKRFSMGVAGRYIHSNLAGTGSSSSGNGTVTKPGQSFAGDISAFYTNKIEIGERDGYFNLGANISNIGTKITYTNDNERDFIPTTFRVGSALGIKIDEFHKITGSIELSKLLVPTQPERDSSGAVSKGKDPDVDVITGMIQSFYDAPGGFGEELKEINPSIGIEYWYLEQFAGRIGYYYENVIKGNRQFLTLGAGIKYNVFSLDFAYLVPTSSQKTLSRSPLENTIRFTLGFTFADKSKRNQPTQ